MVIMTHNTDISDAWSEADDPIFLQLLAAGLCVGLDVRTA
jgi:hypothetical protein